MVCAECGLTDEKKGIHCLRQSSVSGWFPEQCGRAMGRSLGKTTATDTYC